MILNHQHKNQTSRALKIFSALLVFILIHSNFISIGQTQQLIKRCATAIPTNKWEQTFEHYKQKNVAKKNQTNYALPIIVHVIYANSTYGIGDNLSHEQLMSQIDILNDDFAGTGLNSNNTPSVWTNTKANVNITFCPVTRDTNGTILSEAGIERIYYSSKNFTAPGTGGYNQDYVNNTIKPATIWDPTKYLNFWVLDLDKYYLGYATFPPFTTLTGIPSDAEGTMQTDGCVINYRVWGNIGNLMQDYDKGRTATHEIGHWLGLRHISGDDACGDDYCTDTPAQTGGFAGGSGGQNYGCPTYPYHVNSCSNNSNGEMFMNFMDYVDDPCMYLFTNDQATRMHIALNSSPLRNKLFLNNLCDCKQLTSCDTLKNYTESKLVTYKNGNGYLAGSNTTGYTLVAEKIIPQADLCNYNLKGISVYPTKIVGNGTVTLSIWDQSPTTLSPQQQLKTVDIPINTLNINQDNFIAINPPLWLVGNPIYVAVNLNSLTNDTLVLATDTNVSNSTAYYLNSNNTWINVSNPQSGIGQKASLGVKAHVCNSAQNVHDLNWSKSSKFSIIPNPNNGNFSIETNTDEDLLDVHITNVSGQMVFNTSIHKETYKKLTISNLSNGIYFISINSKKYTYQPQRFVINN